MDPELNIRYDCQQSNTEKTREEKRRAIQGGLHDLAMANALVLSTLIRSFDVQSLDRRAQEIASHGHHMILYGTLDKGGFGTGCLTLKLHRISTIKQWSRFPGIAKGVQERLGFAALPSGRLRFIDI